MNRLFQTAPITAGAWLRIVGLALAASVIVAADERLTRPAQAASGPRLPGPRRGDRDDQLPALRSPGPGDGRRR